MIESVAGNTSLVGSYKGQSTAFRKGFLIILGSITKAKKNNKENRIIPGAYFDI